MPRLDLNLDAISQARNGWEPLQAVRPTGSPRRRKPQARSRMALVMSLANSLRR
jgi:hypothetical protein